jgi:hypothetical protein
MLEEMEDGGGGGGSTEWMHRLLLPLLERLEKMEDEGGGGGGMALVLEAAAVRHTDASDGGWEGWSLEWWW